MKKAMSKVGKPPTTNPSCPGRYYHQNGRRCEKCGGVG